MALRVLSVELGHDSSPDCQGAGAQEHRQQTYIRARQKLKDPYVHVYDEHNQRVEYDRCLCMMRDKVTPTMAPHEALLCVAYHSVYLV